MKTLPLYEEYPTGALDREFPEALDGDCDLCGFHEYAKKSVCMKPTGARPKGMDPAQKDNVLLCVLDYPSNEDDLAGKPFSNRSGRYLRGLVNKLWPGPVVFDNAVRCAPGTKVPKKRQDAFKKHVDPCRPYLANTVMDVKPKRIVALGAWAIYSLLGRSLIVPSVRRGYGFMRDSTPVFLMDAPVFGLRNPFLKAQFESDLAYNLKRTVPPLHGLGAVAKMVEPGVTDEVVADLRHAPWATFDIETAGKMYDEDFTVVSVAISRPDTDDSWVWDRWALEDPECLAALEQILTTIPMVAHNAKFDLQGIRLLFGAEVQRKITLHGDTELQRRLNEANVLARLELAAEIVGMGGHKEEADYHLKKTIANARRKTPEGVEDGKQYWLERVAATKADESKAYAFGLLPDDVLSRYNALDTLSTTHYSAHVHKELSNCQKRWNVWEKLVKPAIPAFVEIENKGIAVDRQSLHVFQSYLASRMAEIKRHFAAFDEPGKPFNPGSHPQVRKILYERIGLTPTKFTDTGLASTGAPAIEQYRGQHPFVESLLDFRSIDKMDSTYATGMEKYISDDGRIHPSFKLDGTETGRLSCEKPNGQNIPRADTKEGKMAKDIFVASKGNVLVQLDYSQQELRVAALLSDDDEMAKVFASGHDFHMRTAEMIAKVAWGITPEQWAEMTAQAIADPKNDPRKKYRSWAKSVNFGLLYGKTDSGLAETLGCSVPEAAAIRRAILGRFKKLDKWLKAQIYYAKKHGGIWIPWDEETARWRPLPDVMSENRHKQSNATNAAINTPIQGRASDYCLASITRLQNRIAEDGLPVDIVLTVHDSVIFDTPEWCVDELIEVGREVMTDYDTGPVPLVVDAEVGYRWGSLETYKEAA